MNSTSLSRITLAFVLLVLTFSGLWIAGESNFTVASLVFAGFGFVGFFFYKPRICLFLILFLRIQLDLLWWLPISIGPLNLLAAFTGGITVLGSIMAVLRFSNDIERHPSIHYFIFLTVLLVLGATRALTPIIMIDEFFRIYSPILILFLCVSLFNKKGDWKRLLFLIVMSSLIPIFLSFYHLFDGQMTRIRLQGVQRLLGGYHNLRNQALMMLLFSCCGVYFLFTSKRFLHKSIFLFITLSATLFIYLTQTRATIIVFALFLCVYLYLSKRRALLSGFLAIGIVGVFLNPTIFERFEEFAQLFMIFDQSPQEQDLSSVGSGRYGLWSSSMESYLNHSLPDILLGLGFGSHWVLTRDAYNPFLLITFVDTHNDMLRILYQIGPFGLFFFCMIIYKAARNALWIAQKAPSKEKRDLGALLFGICLAITLNNIFSNGINSRITFGWCFWSIMAAGYILKREIINERWIERQKRLPKESNANAS